MKYDFNTALNEAEKEFNIGKGDVKFKWVNGENKIRILSEFAPMQSTYKGNKSVKFLCWLWDYSDSNKVKLAFLPYTIAKEVGKLQANPRTTFDGAPIPYDLIVNVSNAGTVDVAYDTTSAAEDTDVPAEALSQLADATKVKPIDEVRDLISAKQSAPVTDTPITTEDLPE